VGLLAMQLERMTLVQAVESGSTGIPIDAFL